MSHHAPRELNDADKAVLGAKVDRPWFFLTIGGLAAIVIALVISLPTEHGVARFAFAYTVGFAFAMAITLGNLFFVIITTLFRAGWCAAIRRVAECYAANILTLAVLFIPVLVSVFTPGTLYPWTTPGIHKEGKKIAYHGEPTKLMPHAGEGDSYRVKKDSHSNAADQRYADVRLRPAANPASGSEHTLYAAPPAAAAPAEAHGADHVTPAQPAAHGDTQATTQDHADHDHGQTKDDHAKTDGHDDHSGDGHDAHAADHGDDGGYHVGERHHGHLVVTHTAENWGGHNHAAPYFTYKKGPYLTRPFYVVRWIIYFTLWGLIGGFYYRNSVRQDKTGDPALTNKREWWAPLSVAGFAITTTLAAFDLIMTIDPVWYSTMFGVYFFAGAFTTGICTIILTLMTGQRFGYFPAINTEHFHDLGKLLFAFVFFWGYVGFSQFMLIWYASLPETTYWWEIRGVTSSAGAPTSGSAWTKVAWLVLFGHLIFPFAALLSKHVKRNRKALMAIAIWMLFICWVDLFWITMPALVSPDFLIPIPEILCAVGCVAVLVAGALKIAARASLTAYNDPRMHESLGLDTSAWAPIHH